MWHIPVLGDIPEHSAGTDADRRSPAPQPGVSRSVLLKSPSPKWLLPSPFSAEAGSSRGEPHPPRGARPGRSGARLPPTAWLCLRGKKCEGRGIRWASSCSPSTRGEGCFATCSPNQGRGSELPLVLGLSPAPALLYAGFRSPGAHRAFPSEGGQSCKENSHHEGQDRAAPCLKKLAGRPGPSFSSPMHACGCGDGQAARTRGWLRTVATKSHQQGSPRWLVATLK